MYNNLQNERDNTEEIKTVGATEYENKRLKKRRNKYKYNRIAAHSTRTENDSVQAFFRDVNEINKKENRQVVLKCQDTFNDLPIVFIKVFNRVIKALCDTGASSSVLDEGFLLPSDNTKGFKRVYLESPLIPSPVEAYKTGVHIQIGGFELTHMVCVGPLEGGGAFNMILGFDFFKKNNAIYDINNNNILLTIDQENDWALELQCVPINATSECLYLSDRTLRKEMEQLLEILKPTDFNVEEKIKKEFVDLVSQYKDILIEDVTKLKGTNLEKYRPNFISDKPIYQRQYRIPHSMLAPLRKKIDSFEKANIIKRTESAWNTPILAIKKNEGRDIRIVMDLRRLNDIIEPIPYPLMRIDDALANLSGSKYFSTLDLNNGFYQVGLEENIKDRFCFTVPWGRYRMERLPQGLVTAASVFQKLMNEALHDLIGRGKIFVYQDDLLVHTATAEEHITVLRELFSRLQDIQLAARPSKCKFFCDHVKFLGHIVDRQGSHPTKENIDSILDFPRPCTVKQVRSFMGSINFYRNYIKGITDLAAPLYNLIKKGQVKITWSDECEDAFLSLKSALVTAPVLVHPKFELPFIIKSDASNISIGAVLEQNIDGEIHPLAYCSRKLNRAERNYSVIEREALATVYALQQFRHIVYGYEIALYTDHRPLSYVFKLKDSNQHLMRWMLQIQDYRLKIQYLPGKLNYIADMLSRKAEADDVVQINALRRLPMVISNEFLKVAQSGDDLCKKIFKQIEDNEIQNEEFTIDENGLLLKQIFPDRKSGWRFRIIVPRNIRGKIIANYHDNMYAGHFAFDKVKWKVQQLFTWENMVRDIAEYIRSCPSCQRRRVHRTKAPFQAVAPPSFPLQRLSCDIMGPFTRTSRKNKYIVVWCDHFSRYCWASPIPNMEAVTVAQDYLENIFSRYGASQQIVTDRGANFTSGLFTSLCAKLGAANITTTSFRPCSNGVSERLNSKIIAVLAHICNSHYDDWDLVLPHALLSIRNTVHRSTGESPMYLLHCFDAVDPLVEASVSNERGTPVVGDFVEQVTARVEIARSAIAEHLLYSSVQNCKARNANRKLRNFEVGQKVMFLDCTSYSGKNRKLKPRFIGPFRIVEQRGIVNFKIREIKNSKNVKIVHIDKLKQYFEPVVFDDGNPIDRQVKLKQRGVAYHDINNSPSHSEVDKNENDEDHWNFVVHVPMDNVSLVQNVIDEAPAVDNSIAVIEQNNDSNDLLMQDSANPSRSNKVLEIGGIDTGFSTDMTGNVDDDNSDLEASGGDNMVVAHCPPICTNAELSGVEEGTEDKNSYNLRSKVSLPIDYLERTGYPPLRCKK